MIYLTEEFFLKVIGREKTLFSQDFGESLEQVSEIVKNSSFLVIGGAGSIGSATVKEIFKLNPRVLHIIDISENNLAELVRDIRSSFGYIDGDFRVFCFDAGSYLFDKFMENSAGYDYVLNFSALKHVRSEKDPYTLMRMVDTNILTTIKTVEYAIKKGAKKYFAVSTDKATNPVNMMGASKRIMEFFLEVYSQKIDVSTARFANIAFSDGSLLHSFINRIQKRQPIVIPEGVRRYFMTPREAGVLCLISSVLGNNREIFFPKLNKDDMQTFYEVGVRFLNLIGFEPYFCDTEQEAREKVDKLLEDKKWSCYISKTDTTGEKEYEEFYTDDDQIDWNRFHDIGVIKMRFSPRKDMLDRFLDQVKAMKERGFWDKVDMVKLFESLIPDFKHKETGRYLDQKM